jgi:hypothetical protein
MAVDFTFSGGTMTREMNETTLHVRRQRTNRGWLAVSCVLILVVLGIAQMAIAQETTANIQGVVKDQTGAVVVGAAVEVSGPALMGTKKQVTDKSGAYRFTSLPPGEYTLAVTAPKFKAFKQTKIELSAGREPTIDVQLQVGAAGEVVEVTAEAPQVDVTSSKVSATVEHVLLENLPTGRSFQSVIPFAPGARQEPLQSGSGGRTGGFQIDGASDGENAYLIDGVNTTNIQNGGVGKNFQTDFLQEVQIKSSSFEAEYGGALGGVINAIPKHGSNAWHGEFKTYLQLSALNANDACASGFTSAGFSTVCGQRLLPGTSFSAKNRLDGTPEYYQPKKDARHIIEPGFEVGGPIFKDKLWLFTSYIPTIDTTRRTTTFVPSGPRTLINTFTQHNAYTRLDYQPFNQLRLNGSWNYAYSRTAGQLANPDSVSGQINTSATSDPTTFRGDTGTVNPLSVYTFGGDWTPTNRLVVSAKYGYLYTNTGDRGRPTGVRYLYDTSAVSSTCVLPCTPSRDLAGNLFPTSTTFASGGFANMTSNLQTLFDAYKRNSFNGDASYLVSNLWGSHTFKGGYAWMRQGNDVNRTFNTQFVTLDWGSAYSPVTSTTACDTVKAQNVAAGLPGLCQGLFGFFTVGNGVINTGGDKTYSNALYFQDSWQPSFIKGLTLNLGIRFDEEELPPYDAKRFPSVKFGWGEKIAPRLGGAYDLLHNGKVKVYASYGKFYDIMKMGLSRGSFGSDYWHNCVYAMDSVNFNAITPTGTLGGGCPASGPAPGVTVGRFIENADFRATKADPRDPAIDPNMKPMLQHEFVAGVDWAITKNWSLESRYSRKRLDRTIEDMAITDNLGFYIGNPGTAFADLLHRQFVDDPAVGLQGPLCAECPAVIPAIRRYDGVEFSLARRPGAGKWYGKISYAYSSLTGNYAGLTNTDPTDGQGGRHAPNNHRAFDIPTMTYLPNGKIDDGPLATDRPNTLKLTGYYNLKWLGQGAFIGFNQAIFQGTPESTCLSVVGTTSACQWAEGRGNLVKFHRDPATGDLVSDGVIRGARTPAYLQTDLTLRQEFHPSKDHENYRLTFEADVFNLLNQHSVLAIQETLLAGGQLINPVRAVLRSPGDPGTDWNKVMSGYNYVAEINAEKLSLQNRYGLPVVFQGARNMRLAVKFTF